MNFPPNLNGKIFYEMGHKTRKSPKPNVVAVCTYVTIPIILSYNDYIPVIVNDGLKKSNRHISHT